MGTEYPPPHHGEWDTKTISAYPNFLASAMAHPNSQTLKNAALKVISVLQSSLTKSFHLICLLTYVQYLKTSTHRLRSRN